MTQSDKRPDSTRSARTEYVPTLEINLTDLTRQFRANRRWIVIGVIASMIVTATVMLLTPNRYSSHASVLPSGGQSELGGLMGIASNFGLGASGGVADENSSALYPSILNSDLVRDGVLSRSYTIGKDGQPQTVRLDDYFELTDPNELRAALSKVTYIGSDKKLGIVQMGVETTDPQLSQQVLTEYLAQLEDYLNNKRRSRASDNESYLSRQLEARKAELTNSEDRMQEFMQVNRNWATSTDPELNLQFGRLKREVELTNETCLLLTQQLELARLEAQKDIPIVRLLDRPSLPTQKSGPARTVNTIFAGLVAFTLISLWILGVSFVRQLTGGQETETDNEPSDTISPHTNRVRGLIRLKRKEESIESVVD